MPEEIASKIISQLENSKQQITLEKSFYYATTSSIFLKDPNTENFGRKIIINALNNWNKLPQGTCEMWTDLIEAAGFYPYLEKHKDTLIHKNLSGELRKELHHSNNLANVYFHSEQKDLCKILDSEKNLVVSAPTSFGKSLLIEELVSRNTFSNIIIIQPTLALLDETRRKLIKYANIYKLIVRTNQEPSTEKGNIYLFTAERVQEYKQFSKVDLLVVDEFYKLSKERDDERWDVLNNAVYQTLSKFNSKFYLLGPNIAGISEGFAEKYNAEFFKTDFSLVDNKVIDVYGKNKKLFDAVTKRGTDPDDLAKKELILFKQLYELRKEQNIIYCSSPERARSLALKFYDFLSKKVDSSKEELPLVEWIKKNVGDKWNLIDCLSYQIGIHDGALQKHIGSSIINYFNEGRIKYLFCTSTIIEGVNTSAKNIIIYDQKKGNKPIDFFDYSNIKGRAGRMMVHFVGNVYSFIPTPTKGKNIIVDIPFYDQKSPTKEILNGMKPEDIKNKNDKEYKALMKIPKGERELFKRNGVSVDGQKKILEQLRIDVKLKSDLIFWESAYPNFNHLKYLFGLTWKHLFKTGKETSSPVFTAANLARLTNKAYRYKGSQNIHELINEQLNTKKGDRDFYDENSDEIERELASLDMDNKKEFRKTENFKKYDRGKKYKGANDLELYNQAVTDIFQLYRHWFQYKVPKWLSVMHELQSYVCNELNLKPANYSFYSNLIENDGLNNNVSILLEYGIPSSAIRKLETMIHADVNQDDILKVIQQQNLHNQSVFIEYERQKIEENISKNIKK